jgi:murein DD-endopeptidase MepM/ murein hydrolase activator NlpD
VPDRGTGTFTVAPLAVEALVNITALGNLNPPAHTTPSDHTYWNLTGGPGTSPQLPVYAPASGVVSDVRGGDDYKIMVNVTNTFVYYLDHIIPSAGIAQGSRVSAGDRIGVSSGRAAGIDFGLINMERPLAGLLAPDRYPAETRYADNPLKYYDEPLRTQLYAKVLREGP